MSFDLQLINGDLSLNADGSIRTVTGTDKLKQDIVKIILTPIGSVIFHPWYGSSITDENIGEVIPIARLSENITIALSESLGRLQKLQRSQATGQKVLLSEMISTVKEIAVQRNSIDLRQVNVIVVVISRDLTTVEEVFTISG